MSEIFEKLLYYFQFPFVRYALVVGILVALCSAIFGVILVLRRFSFIGDGLSHAAFGALAVSTVLGVRNELFVVLPVTAVLAVFLLRAGRKRKIKGDAALAVLSVGALAVGYLLLSVSSTTGNVSGDVCSTLFGATSILTLSELDVLLSVVLSVIVIALFVLFYNRIFAVTFDESFAEATGVKTEAYNTVIAIVTAVIIVLGMKLVGSLLISALIVFPTLSAMRIFKRFSGVVVFSALVSVICSGGGIILSILTEAPVGPSIVLMNMVCFGVCTIIGKR